MPLLREALSAKFGERPFSANSLNTVADNWNGCPTCGRRAVDLATLNQVGEILCCSHLHHDHIVDHFKELFAGYAYCACWGNWINDAGAALSAFRPTRICSFCNEAEGAAKRAIGADKWFSFTPDELARIVRINGPGPVTFDSAVASAIWNDDAARLADHRAYAKRFFDLATSGKIGPRGHQLRLRRPDEPSGVRELACDGSYKNKTAARRAGRG